MRCAIIGAGISGLSAAYFLHRKSVPGLQVDVYDARPRVGGVLATVRRDGCVVEGGPDSFLTQKKAASKLCAEIGIQDQLVGSNDAIRKTFVFHEGKLKQLPEGFFMMVPTKLWPLVKTDLISWPGKFAALRDLFFYPERRDVSVARFIEERFGLEVLNNIAEPMLSGVYGGDVGNLSLKSAVPMIWDMQKRGSLIAGMLKYRNARQQESLFTTLGGGMASLGERLQESCAGVGWKLGTAVKSVERTGAGRWRIGESDYEALLIATTEVPEMPTANGKRIAQLVRSVRKNSAVVVGVCFDGDQYREGFGWLVPRAERHSLMAATYVNNKFPGRAPGDVFLVRCFFGGRDAEKWIERTNEEILQETLSELKRIAGIDGTPRFYEVHRWGRSMPEYAVGHDLLIMEVGQLAAREPNLYLTGNIFRGIGIPDCIAHSEKVAEEIASRLRG